MPVAQLGLDSLDVLEMVESQHYTRAKSSWMMRKDFTEGIDYSASGTPENTWSQSSRSVATIQSTIDGYKLPGYKDLIANGTSATTPFIGVAQKYWYEPGLKATVYFKSSSPSQPNGTARSYFNGHIGLAPVATHLYGLNTARAESKALVSIRRAIKAQYSQWDSLTFLGELGQTVAMFKRPFSGLLKGLLQYNHNLNQVRNDVLRIRKRAVRIAKMTKGIADAYIEFSFGVKPLMSDAEDAALALARLLKGEEIVHTEVKGFGIEELRNTAHYASNQQFASYIVADLAIDTRTTLLVVYRAGLSKRIQGPLGSVELVQQLCGFDLANFVPTIWNLLPWSWLADYVYNIGDVLEADYVDTSSVRWLNRTSVTETNEIGLWTMNQSYAQSVLGTYFLSQTGSMLGRSHSVYRTVNRGAVGYVPYPNIVRKIDVPSELSDGKIANLVAIATGAILGKQLSLAGLASRGAR